MQPNNPTNPTTPPQPEPTPLPSQPVENTNLEPTQPTPQLAQPIDSATQTSATTPNPQPTSPDLVTEAKKTVEQISKLTKGTLQKKHIWALGAMGLVAIIAIIIAIAQSVRAMNMQSQMETMSKELDEKTQLVTKYAAQLGLDVSQSNNPNLRPPVKPDTSDDENDNQGETKPTEKYIASADYIYIGEWGIKIKIPNGLKDVSYRFDNIQFAATEESEAFAIESLCISGILDAMTVTPEAFRVDNQAGLGCLSRTTSTAHADNPNIVKELDGYYYEYAHPQAILSTDEQEQKQEADVTKLIEQMLTNPDNLIKF